MWKEYPYLHNSFNESIKTYTKKQDFLSQIDKFLNQKTYIKITLLDWYEQPIKEIEGNITSGSLTKNGASTVRRTGSLTVNVSSGTYNIDNMRMDFAINKKIFIEIGLKNYTNKYPEYPTLWFPQGVFYITNINIASSASSAVNLSISIGDKMLGLNGDISGKLPSSVTFDTRETQKLNGEIIKEKVKIYDLILELVHHFGGESLNNILIEDIPLTIKRVIKWSGNNPLYLIEDFSEESLAISNYIPTIEKPDSSVSYSMYINGQDVGYVNEDFVFEKELTASAGESICSVLDKIKNYLGNFEYYYDEFGVFHFREIKNYLNKTFASVVDEDISKYQNIDEKMYLVDITTDKNIYNFRDSSNIISLNQNPQYGNIKNDFIVEGMKKTTSSDKGYPVRYHLAIDYKPTVGNEYYNLLLYRDPKTKDILANFPMEVDKLPMVGNSEIIYKCGKIDSKEKEDYEKARQDLNWLKDEEQSYSSFVFLNKRYQQVLRQKQSELSTIEKQYISNCNSFIVQYEDAKKIHKEVNEKYEEFKQNLFSLQYGTPLKLEDLKKNIITNTKDIGQKIIEILGLPNKVYEKYKNVIIDKDKGYDILIKRIEEMDKNFLKIDAANLWGIYEEDYVEKVFWPLVKDKNYKITKEKSEWTNYFSSEDKVIPQYIIKDLFNKLKSNEQEKEIKELKNYNFRWEDHINGQIESFETKINNYQTVDALVKDIKIFIAKDLSNFQESLNSIFNISYLLYENYSSVLDIIKSKNKFLIEDFISKIDMITDWLKTQTSKKGTEVINVEQMNDPSNIFYYWTGTEYKKIDRVAYYPEVGNNSDKLLERYNTINWSPSSNNKEVPYIPKDWRTEIYLQGLLAETYGTSLDQSWGQPDRYYTPLMSGLNGTWEENIYALNRRDRIDVTFYADELKSFWPTLYNLELQKWVAEANTDELERQKKEYERQIEDIERNKDSNLTELQRKQQISLLREKIIQCDHQIDSTKRLQRQSLTDGMYYLDFIDPRESSKFSEYAVSTIGRRTQATVNKDINCLFEPEVKEIVFINTSDEETYQDALDLCIELGQTYVQTPGNIWAGFSTGGQGNAAFDQIKTDLWTHTFYQRTLSLTAIPVYYLEPNSRTSIYDRTTNTYGDFMINSISYNFSPGTGMSVSCSECVQKF